MADETTMHAGRYEPVSRALFLGGGVLLVLYGALLGLDAALGMTYETAATLVAGTGGTLAFLALLGLYDRYVGGRPWLTRVAALATGVGAVGFGALAALSAGELLGVATVPESGPILPLVLVGMIPGFGLFGLAAYLTGEAPRMAALVVAPAVVFAVIVVTGVAGLTPRWFSAILGVLHGLSYLGIWWGLTADWSGAGRPEPSTDSAV